MGESAQHTPGPWQVGGQFPMATFVYAGRACVATCRAGGGDLPHAANARLIAAAPELLGLAKRLARECAHCHGTRRVVVATDHVAGCCDDGACITFPVTEDCSACADIWAVIDRAEGTPK